MDEFKWAGTAHSNSVNLDSKQQHGDTEYTKEESGKKWDWFITSLDISRVRATLTQFPVWDDLECSPIPGVEVWITDDDENKDEVDGIAIDIVEDGSESSSVVSTDSDDSSQKLVEDKRGSCSSSASRNRSKCLDEWNGIGPDIRYSPAFILPLIFGVMECFLARAEEPLQCQTGSDCEHRVMKGDKEAHESADDDENRVNREAFAVVAHRLCDKGALSLAFASLSSSCPALRQVAVATLGLFVRALCLKEAHEISAWRDRPQLAMIINSVQRGLVVRRATQISRRGSVVPPADLLVPMLPAVSAIFLARASLIIVKPGDALFAPLNKFFLRIDHDCGAYQDISRLPAFISLFCSSSDEPGQARRERLWALQQLKDGFVDEGSCRAVLSCHAPELLMTSFDSYASRYEEGDGDLERILLLETLTTVIARGGNRAARHLFSRVGLLSWIRAILVGRPMCQVLPTVLCQTKFLRLLSVAVETARLTLDSIAMEIETFVEEVSNLARPVLQLYTSSQSNVELEHGHRVGVATDSVVEAICNALSSLRMAVSHLPVRSSSSRAGHLLGARPHGMHLAPAVSILLKAPENLMRKVVGALCTLPFSFDPQGSTNATSFCNHVLKFVLIKSGNEDSLIGDVLRRVSILSMLFESALDPEGEVLRLVLACRRKCVNCIGVWSAWAECVANLLDHQSDAGSDATAICIAKDILQVTKETSSI